MKCPSCGTEIGPLPAKCVPCGKSFVAKKPAAAPPAVKKPLPEAALDLAPEVAPSAEAAAAAGPAPAPVRTGRPGTSVRSGGQRGAAASRGGGAGMAGGLIRGGITAVIVIAVLIGGYYKVFGKTYTEKEFVLGPGNPADGEGYSVKGKFEYTVEVTALDGPLKATFGKVANSNKITEADVVKLLVVARDVAVGAKVTLSGSVSDGHYAWMVVNPNDKTTVRAKVRFHAKEK